MEEVGCGCGVFGGVGVVWERCGLEARKKGCSWRSVFGVVSAVDDVVGVVGSVEGGVLMWWLCPRGCKSLEEGSGIRM